MSISHSYKKPAVRTAVAQGIVLVFGSLVLDGGFFFLAALIAVAAYWAGFLVVIARHPESPTRGDLIWASAGFAITLALTFAFGPLVVQLRGHG
jgi:hypothetical protein